MGRSTLGVANAITIYCDAGVFHIGCSEGNGRGEVETVVICDSRRSRVHPWHWFGHIIFTTITLRWEFRGCSEGVGEGRDLHVIHGVNSLLGLVMPPLHYDASERVFEERGGGRNPIHREVGSILGNTNRYIVSCA